LALSELPETGIVAWPLNLILKFSNSKGLFLKSAAHFKVNLLAISWFLVTSKVQGALLVGRFFRALTLCE